MLYTLTVFTDRGETLLDDTFESPNDSDAREEGIRRLKEGQFEHKGARVTRAGKLIHFERAYLPKIVPVAGSST